MLRTKCKIEIVATGVEKGKKEKTTHCVFVFLKVKLNVKQGTSSSRIRRNIAHKILEVGNVWKDWFEKGCNSLFSIFCFLFHVFYFE